MRTLAAQSLGLEAIRLFSVYRSEKSKPVSRVCCHLVKEMLDADGELLVGGLVSDADHLANVRATVLLDKLAVWILRHLGEEDGVGSVKTCLCGLLWRAVWL